MYWNSGFWDQCCVLELCAYRAPEASIDTGVVSQPSSFGPFIPRDNPRKLVIRSELPKLAGEVPSRPTPSEDRGREAPATEQPPADRAGAPPAENGAGTSGGEGRSPSNGAPATAPSPPRRQQTLSDDEVCFRSGNCGPIRGKDVL